MVEMREVGGLCTADGSATEEGQFGLWRNLRLRRFSSKSMPLEENLYGENHR